MTYLIDTDWVINHLRGADRVTVRLAELAPQGLAVSIISLAEPRLNKSRSCTCTCYVQVFDKDKTDQFRDAVAKSRALAWRLNLNWKLTMVGYPRQIDVQQAPAGVITMVPSRI